MQIVTIAARPDAAVIEKQISGPRSTRAIAFISILSCWPVSLAILGRGV